MSFTKNDNVICKLDTLFSWAKMMSPIVSFCLGLSLDLISTSYYARKLKFIEVHTPPLFEPFILNAKVYFSELNINTCELKDSWQQLNVDGNLI